LLRLSIGFFRLLPQQLAAGVVHLLNKLVASKLTKIESWRYPAVAGVGHCRKKARTRKHDASN
jgi:hypothetical protein